MPLRVTFLCLLVLPLTVRAAEVDKRAYTLANPTPAALLRELSTDRPDTTESPFTVDAGHTQLEMDFANVMRDRQGGVRTTSVAIAPFNLRLGLRHNLEAGIFFDPYVRETEQPRGGAKARMRGVGDTTLRLKLNFWGNDGGETALGMFVDVKLPTASHGIGNDKVEGTCTFPFALQLGGGWEMGAMTSVAAAHDGTRYQPIWVNTVTVSHDLFEHLGAYCELTSQAGDGPHVCTFDTGLAWQLTRDLQVDAGVNLGVSRRAPDVTWFAGMSRRF